MGGGSGPWLRSSLPSDSDSDIGYPSSLVTLHLASLHGLSTPQLRPGHAASCPRANQRSFHPSALFANLVTGERRDGQLDNWTLAAAKYWLGLAPASLAYAMKK